MRRSALLLSAAVLAGCGSSVATGTSPGASATPAVSKASKTSASSAVASPSSAKPAGVTTTALETGVVSPIITGTDPIVEGTPLPPVPTIDLHTGNIVRLDWLLPGEKPVLVWFWAPH
jgi:hypothetical protein